MVWASLTNGLDTLSSNNAALQAGAQQVADGVLASANSTLMEGGLIDTPMTLGQLRFRY